MRRAGVSVASNIVEGCAGKSQNDYCRFLKMAYGSLRELHYQFGLSVFDWDILGIKKLRKAI